jgi:ferredoxin-NADP reductase
MNAETREVRARVADVRPETPDAATLRLDLGEQAFPYRPGQYVEIDPHQFPELADEIARREADRGMPEPPRGFSLASDGLDPRFLEISIKEEHRGPLPPLLTPLLVRGRAVGRELVLRGPLGNYCLPERPPDGITGFLHLCAGSGVAPNRGMIRHALGRGWPQRHLLLLQNRTEEDVFYRDEWPALRTRHPDRFRLRLFFSRSRGERVTVEEVRREMEGFLDPAASWAFVCGPNRPREAAGPDGARRREPGFCDLWCGSARRRQEGLLARVGISPDRIRTEMW